jgi:hypothetical protein
MVYISDTQKKIKRLENFEEEIVKDYQKEEYPNYVKFVKHLLRFMDLYSVNEFKEDSDNSYYYNLCNFIRFMHVDQLPLDSNEIAQAYIKDYASTLDFRNSILKSSNEELRDILKNVSNVYALKSNSKSYDFYIRLVDYFTLSGVTKKFKIDVFFNRQNASITDVPPDYDNIDKRLILKYVNGTFVVGDKIFDSTGTQYGTVEHIYVNEFGGSVYFSAVTSTNIDYPAGMSVIGNISGATATVVEYNTSTAILTELPYYKYDDSTGTVVNETLAEWNKGTSPFNYQLVCKDKDFYVSNLFKTLDDNFRPSGYNCWIFIQLDDMEADVYAHISTFPKIYLHTSFPDVPVITAVGQFPASAVANQGLAYYVSGTVAAPYGLGGPFTDTYVHFNKDDGKWYEEADPEFEWNIIRANSDFPLPYTDPSGVRYGDIYIIGAGVTDNDPTKTNTGMIFTQHKYITWYGDGVDGSWF